MSDPDILPNLGHYFPEFDDDSDLAPYQPGRAKAKKWRRNLEALRESIAATGKWPTLRSVWTRKDGSQWRLGGWVSAQRNLHRYQRLQQHRVAILEVEPWWDWGDAQKTPAKPWSEWMGVLREYIAEHKGELPPYRLVWKRADGTSWNLGHWTSAQRCLWRKGRLDATREAELNSVREWVWNYRRNPALRKTREGEP